MKAKLHTVKPHAKFGWTGRMAWITAVHNWTMRHENGKCLVTVEESMKGFLTGLIKNPLKKGMKQSLKELKTAAEK